MEAKQLLIPLEFPIRLNSYTHNTIELNSIESKIILVLTEEGREISKQVISESDAITMIKERLKELKMQ